MSYSAKIVNTQTTFTGVLMLTSGIKKTISVPEGKGEKVGSDTSYIDLNHSPECRVVHACQICGKGTKNLDFMLCDECRKALKKMIYGGDDGKIN